MKSTGIVRRVDDLGRIVIPKEIRRINRIAEGDAMEIFVNGNQIVLQKYEPVLPGCVFTGRTDELITFEGKLVSTLAIVDMAIAAGLEIR